MPFPEHLHLTILAKLNEFQIKGVALPEDWGRPVGDRRHYQPQGVVASSFHFSIRRTPYDLDEVLCGIRELLARNCIREYVHEFMATFPDGTSERQRYRAYQITAKGLRLLDAGLPRDREASTQNPQKAPSAEGSKPDDDLREWRSADWFFIEHGVPQSRLSEKSHKIKTRRAPGGIKDSQGKTVRKLYHLPSAIKALRLAEPPDSRRK